VGEAGRTDPRLLRDDGHLRKLTHDPLTSFAPICELVNSPTVIVVNVASPYRTLADLLEAARVHARDRRTGPTQSVAGTVGGVGSPTSKVSCADFVFCGFQ
jgi:hypothetical protein